MVLSASMGVRLLISSCAQFFYNIVILYGVKQRNLFHIHFIVMYRLFLLSSWISSDP